MSLSRSAKQLATNANLDGFKVKFEVPTPDWQRDQNKEPVYDCSPRSIRECVSDDFSSAYKWYGQLLQRFSTNSRTHTQHHDIQSVLSAGRVETLKCELAHACGPNNDTR